MKIVKTPEFENDSYYIIVEKHDEIVHNTDCYLNDKRKAFLEHDVSKSSLEKYFCRSSFTGVDSQRDLSGTIYTRTSELKNNMKYKEMLQTVIENKDNSRRCVIVIADTLKDYMDNSLNTSCLNIIHYFENTVKLFFRASDMKNELLYDIHLIREFFIDPVFFNDPEIHIIASTAQNIIDPKILIKNK